VFLTEFRVGGFKAFRDTQRLPIKPITLVFGPNSGGKSSLIHALLLAHEGVTRENLDAHTTQIGGDNVDLGGFRQYVFRRDVNADVELGFRLAKPPLPDEASHLLDNDWNVCVRLAFDKKPYVREYTLESEGGRIRLTRESSDAPLALTQIGTRAAEKLHVFTEEETPDSGNYPLAGDDKVYAEMEADYFWPWFEVTGIAAKCPGLVAQRLHGEDGDAVKVRQESAGELTATLQTDDRELPGYVTWEEWKQERGITDVDYEERRDGPLSWSEETESHEAYRQHICSLRKTAEHWIPAVPFAELNDMVRNLHARIAGGFGSMRYLGPFRAYPPRRLITYGEYDPNYHSSGASAWDVVRTDSEVREAVNRWLGSGLLQTPFRLEAHPYYDVEPLARVLSAQNHDPVEIRLALERLREKGPAAIELQLTDERTGTLVSHRDIGVGISQVLPVLAEAYGSRGATIVIEQPEIHLHPALQAELGDVFIKAALSERENTFIVETHSEHLLLRILRRIRETTDGKGAIRVTTKDVQVVYVEPTNEGSVVREMPLTPDGDLAVDWPGGFFAERAAELF